MTEPHVTPKIIRVGMRSWKEIAQERENREEELEQQQQAENTDNHDNG